MKRLFLFLLFLAPACFAQQTSSLITIADLSMTGSAVALTGTTHTFVHWCMFTSPSGNAATIAWGDSTVTLTKGSTLDPGGRQGLPASGPTYDLSTIYFIGTSGDKVKATCQIY